MAKKDEKSLTTDSTDGPDAEGEKVTFPVLPDGVIDMRGTALGAQIDAALDAGKCPIRHGLKYDPKGVYIGPAEEPCSREMYDRYYCSALSGALAFYGVNRTKLAVLDDMAHRMAMQSLASEGMRRREAAGMMAGEDLTTE